MTNYSTPKQFQNLNTQKLPTSQKGICNLMPSEFTMSFVLGYSAALEIYETKTIGKTEILNN